MTEQCEAFELKVDTREPGSSLGTGGMSTKADLEGFHHGFMDGSGFACCRCWLLQYHFCCLLLVPVPVLVNDRFALGILKDLV